MDGRTGWPGPGVAITFEMNTDAYLCIASDLNPENHLVERNRELQVQLVLEEILNSFLVSQSCSLGTKVSSTLFLQIQFEFKAHLSHFLPQG